MVELRYFELKAGDTKSIRYVRDTGARVRSKLILPPDATGVTIKILSEKSETVASNGAAADGTFLTERIAPGKYVLLAYAYKPLTDKQARRSGLIGPAYDAQMTIEVPDEGELTVKDLILKPIRRDK
jgi:hypothetical protein